MNFVNATCSGDSSAVPEVRPKDTQEVRSDDNSGVNHLQSHVVHRHSIQAIGLWRFRHVGHAHYHPEGRPVMLSGINGVGKTNIIEAISLLSPGRGVRQAQTEQFLRRGSSASQGWKVEATLESGYRLSTFWQSGHPRRQVKVEDEKISQLRLGEFCRCLSLGPRDDQLFLHGDEAMRRFMDRLIAVLDPEHISRVQALRQLQKQWRDLLDSHTPSDPQWLAAIEARLAAQIVVVTAARASQARGLQQMMQTLPDFVARHNPPSQGHAWILQLTGVVKDMLADMPARLVEHNITEHLERARHSHTLVQLVDRWQCHLRLEDDKVIEVAALSHGQQKMALLAVILAQAWIMRQKLGIVPVILLDEAISQLDKYHAHLLLYHLHQLDCQYWISGIDLTEWHAALQQTFLIKMDIKMDTVHARSSHHRFP